MEKQSPVIFQQEDSLDFFIDEDLSEDPQESEEYQEITEDKKSRIRKTHTVKHRKVSIVLIILVLLNVAAFGGKYYLDQQLRETENSLTQAFTEYKALSQQLNDAKELSESKSEHVSGLNNIKGLTEVGKASEVTMVYNDHQVAISCKFKTKKGLNKFLENIGKVYTVKLATSENDESLFSAIDNEYVYQAYLDYTSVKSKNKLFVVLEV